MSLVSLSCVRYTQLVSILISEPLIQQILFWHRQNLTALESNYCFSSTGICIADPQKWKRQIHSRIDTQMELLYIMLLTFFTIGSTRVSEIVFFYNAATRLQNRAKCSSQLKTVILIAVRLMFLKCYDRGQHNLGKIQEELFLSLLLWHCSPGIFVVMLWAW